MKNRRSRLTAVLGVDFHILQTLLFRGWTILAGGVMVVLIPFVLTPEDQGIYFTYLSLIGIQIFFELGFNQVLVQLIGHEAAHLRAQPDGTLQGASVHLTRLAELMELVRRWYLIIACLFFVIGGGAGAWFFVSEGYDVFGREVIVWIVTVFFSAIALYFSPRLSMLEGFGNVGEVARVRLTQSIVGYLALWSGLGLGFGLLAAPAIFAVAAVYGGYWLFRHDQRFWWLLSLKRDRTSPKLSWRKDIAPLQWRIAVSWASGYLILQLLVPMTFAHRGAVEAGRLGLALTIFNSLLSIGLSWTNARLPSLAMHIARAEDSEARSVFRIAATRSTLVTAVGSLGVVLCSALAPGFVRDRFVDAMSAAYLAGATVSNSAIYAMATFVRAHKIEPFLGQSIATALIMAPAVYLASQLGVQALTGTFAGIIIAIGLPWVAIIFAKYYRR